MLTLKACITPLSAFGSPFKGDTLYGQLCWAIRNRQGEEALAALLDGYTEGKPFVVVSDAFPSSHLPRPVLPIQWFEMDKDADRKAIKKLAWLPLDKFMAPTRQWLSHCQPASAIPDGAASEHPQPHNTLNRETGSTGQGQFAPYVMNQLWYGQKIDQKNMPPASVLMLDVYLVLDETRLAIGELRQLLDDIGAIGFGRDASIGLGKFRVEALESLDPLNQPEANAWLTLAPCAPQGLKWDTTRSFYTPFTRFGRHGDIAVHMAHGPFKSPVLLANTGAVLTPLEFRELPFTGRGLGADGSLSKAIPETVHQGYAPVAGIKLPERDAA